MECESELDTLQRKASACLSVDRYEDARALLRRAFELDPDDPQTLTLAARCESRVQNTPRAIEMAQRAIAASPQAYEPRLLLALLLEETYRYPEAERLLLALIHDFPEEPEPIAYYGLLMFYALHLEKAEALAAEALRIEPENSTGQLVANLSALSRGDDKAASAAIARALEADPNNEVLLSQVGLVLQDQHRYAEALEVYQRLLRNNPSDADYVEAVIGLRAASHPLTWISRTAERVGMGGMFAVYVLAIAAIHQLDAQGYVSAAGWLALGWILIVVWSWTGNPIMLRWVRMRGVR